MFKMLYVDALCPAGHKVFNSLTISALISLDAEIRIVGDERCLPENTIIAYRIPSKYLIKRKSGGLSKLTYRINEYQKLRWLVKVIEKEHPDLVILSSYETISLSIVSRPLKIPVLAFNHNNLDELESKLKRFFYRRIGGSVSQVVFENYMADYLKEAIKVRNKVIVLPHIVEPEKQLQPHPQLSNANSKFLFAPSSSNDLTVIEDLLKRAHELKAKGIKLVAKYRENVNRDALVFRKRFSDEEYVSFLRSCFAVYVPLPRHFNYRISNVVNEAIAKNKKIIISNNRFSEFICSKYPSLVYVLRSDLLEEADEWKKWIRESSDSYEKERQSFLNNHSAEKFAEDMVAELPMLDSK